MSKAIKDYNSIDWNSFLVYDTTSETGIRWKEDRMAGDKMKIFAARKGDSAGSIQYNSKTKYTYCVVPHKGSLWFIPRVIWIMNYGYLSNDLVIDHIDGDTLNNKLSNLRAVSQRYNNRNTSKRKDNNSGTCGVYFTTAKRSKGGIFTYATASWYNLDGTRQCKHFPTHYLGLLPAFMEAVVYRNTKLTELNSNGAGYTEHHGQ